MTPRTAGRSEYGETIELLADQRMKFRYENWHNEHHVYVIDAESIQFGPYTPDGIDHGGEPVFVLHGRVFTRDDDPRPEMDPRRRTFIMSKIEDLETL